MPMLRMHMYAQGIQLYCAPTADHRDTWLPSMRHIALEGRCFVLSACQYLTRADCPEDYTAIQGNDPATVLMRGGSSIVGPSGPDLSAGPNLTDPASSPRIWTSTRFQGQIRFRCRRSLFAGPISSASTSTPSPCHRWWHRRSGFIDPFRKEKWRLFLMFDEGPLFVFFKGNS